MTTKEADAIGEAIRLIERGLVDKGVGMLREVIDRSGHRAPTYARDRGARAARPRPRATLTKLELGDV
jgi:hypothetical protein